MDWDRGPKPVSKRRERRIKETYGELEIATWTRRPQRDASSSEKNSMGHSSDAKAHTDTRTKASARERRKSTANRRSQLGRRIAQSQLRDQEAPIKMSSWKIPTQVDPNSLSLRHSRHIVGRHKKGKGSNHL